MLRSPASACLMACAAVLIVSAGPGLRGSAPAKPAAPDPDYHDVALGKGKKSGIIRVKDVVGPRLPGQTSGGPYNPTNLDLGRSSSFSNKSFTSGDTALSKSDAASEMSKSQFLTKSYSGETKGDSTADFGKSYKTSAFATSTRDAGDDQKKSFVTSGSDIVRGKDTSFAMKTSLYQDQSATLGGPKNAPYGGSSSFSGKTFSDPEMTHVRRDPYASASNLDVGRMVDLPNRPLTIDEVRNLINHESVPNLNAKPDEPSRALNDPEWEPPTAPSLPREKTLNPPADEKDSELPSPGMMADPNPSAKPAPLPK